ncbi:PAS domain-containing sensor histidine kinase [Hymenobacter cheonanensis]|uniref:PAS domain-containing sensor histidine kinase n=1 Tax=Hymenobacter sp. CA2-7 TaxID=3063993 RepID=UPI002712AC69|nr:PAS domain-containing protein [Hymenobacter sp. CA2-7]MDO7887001.1 PAS domain-containing protein [Hymenobacter sp. CA2-7]
MSEISVSTVPPSTGLAEVLLVVSLTGIMLMRPRYAAGTGELCDFDSIRLNPAAQRMLRLPEYPAESFLTLYPTAAEAGVFAFYRDAFLSGQLAQRQNLYQHDGLDGYYALVAQRCEELLAVSFTDNNDHSRTAAEEALRASQARELAARQEAERERATLQLTLEQAPIAIAILDGPTHVVTFANEEMALLWGRPLAQIIGRPHFEALPDLGGQGFEAIFAEVYQTGQPYYLREQYVDIARAGSGQLAPGYFHIVYQPLRNARGIITGIIASATEVTEQVLARQQAEQLAHTLEVQVLARTQEATQQSHYLERLLMEAPAAICTLAGPDLVFELVNPGYQALFPGRQLAGQAVLAALPELAGGPVEDMLRGVYETGVTFHGDEVLMQFARPNDGQLEDRYFNFIYQARYDTAGSIDGLVVFAFEVTEQVRTRRQTTTMQAAMLAVAQRRAQERQDLYQIFEQTPAAIVLLREPNHRIDYYNPAFEELFPPEEWLGPIQGHTLGEVYPRVKLAGLVALLDRVYDTGESQVVLEMPLAELQPGSPRYVTFAYQAYREAEVIVGVAAFVYDVTEQVLARHAREAQQQQLEELLAQAPVAICVFRGPDYVLELVNPLMGDMLEHAPGQITGRPFFEAVPELDGQGLRAVLDEVRRTGVPYVAQSQPYRLARHRPGEVGYFDFVYQPLHRATSELAVVCVATEVTAQVTARQQVHALNEELAAINAAMRATNEELHQANLRLTRTNADLDTFVYSASHDLKSPITNIEGLLLALRQQLPPAAQQPELVPRLLELMDGAVRRFQQTLGHLTDVTRLQQAMLDQPTEAVDLLALAEDVRLDMQPELTAADATLTLDLAACPTVYFAAKNLRSILYNLLSNAVKYRAPDRPAVVELRCRPAAPGQVVLEVQDNGLGLSEQQQGELFRLFRRLHHHVPGSGVGLYMVKKMVENAGGTLTVQSQPGVGSTFTVVLPAPGPTPS